MAAYEIRKTDSKILKKRIKIKKREPLKQELKSFISCIQNNTKPLVSGEEGKLALSVALDILEKIASKKK